ncbi:RimJ/RimL family protein N-acetyltransferase [Kineococcus radiotolerans]|uniref:RimJ/RimL family protein N-acetyltransferase n=1 Tax=Kineococcus radiotolerans TaxID=131568 RepID=A0A7W4TQS8_KINRA|nr:GNAT family N-acetyltransferase [Kineococcus radiotolerans]MBB2903410.1 RimJ/RimL family protein N-acetyltransferase [Kineococcus radiotolerans]
MTQPDHDGHDVNRPLHDTTTTRLSLRRPTDADAAELFTMYSDPQVWRDDPLLRHTSADQTRDRIHRWSESWDRHGIGPWVMRVLTGPAAGDLVGSGGCSLYTTGTTTVWNMAFILRPPMWGQGYAQEVAAAGRRCAHMLRPDLPVTAIVAARNPRSQRAVERTGLNQAWRGPDTKDPDPAAQLLLYTDRALSKEQVRALTA